MSNLIVTITGPSCAGKSTLERMMRDQLDFENVISTTTRPMREGEIDGASYRFISREAFDKNEADGCYIESVEFNGNKYGVSAEEAKRVFAKGRPMVVVVEPNGMKQISAYAADNGWRLFSVFISNPASVIAERFLRRFHNQTLLEPEEVVDKSIETYAARLGTMLTEEIGWQFEASMTDGLYNLKEWNFDEGNSQCVLDLIEKHAVNGEEIQNEAS